MKIGKLFLKNHCGVIGEEYSSFGFYNNNNNNILKNIIILKVFVILIIIGMYIAVKKYISSRNGEYQVIPNLEMTRLEQG